MEGVGRLLSFLLAPFSSFSRAVRRFYLPFCPSHTSLPPCLSVQLWSENENWEKSLGVGTGESAQVCSPDR